MLPSNGSEQRGLAQKGGDERPSTVGYEPLTALEHTPRTTPEQTPRITLSVRRERTLAHRHFVREMFNVHELRLDELFTMYDVDKSGFLSMPEIKILLTDFNSGVEPTPEELNWIVKIADKDLDSQITRNELLITLRAWVGYITMESQLSTLFDQSDINKDSHLSIEELQNFLTKINGHQVSMTEAQDVMDVADKLKDNTIARYELLGAVASWYISVGREPTPAMSLAFAANNNTGGRCHTVIHWLIALSLAPCAYFPLQAGYGTSSKCAMDFRSVLLADGWLWLVMTVIVLMKGHWVRLFHACLGRNESWKLVYRMSWLVIGLEVSTVMILFVVEGIGLWLVHSEKSFPEEEIKTCEAGAQLPISFHDSIQAREWRTYESLIEFTDFWFVFNFWFNFVTLIFYYAHIAHRYFKAREADRLMQANSSVKSP